MLGMITNAKAGEDLEHGDPVVWDEAAGVVRKLPMQPRGYPDLESALRIMREDRVYRLVSQGVPRNTAEMPMYDGIQCTCKIGCDFPCNGSCGCEAHAAAYGDALEDGCR